jgi:hypothetical protein
MCRSVRADPLVDASFWRGFLYCQQRARMDRFAAASANMDV